MQWALFGIEKGLLALLVVVLAMAWPRAQVTQWLERLAELCRRRPARVLAVTLVAAYGLAWMTTWQTAAGDGYGFDGLIYGQMAVDPRAPAPPPQSYRSLVPLVAHGFIRLGAATFTAFYLVNALSYAGAGWVAYALARRLDASAPVAIAAAITLLTTKLSLKFWLHYPVLTDAMGLLLLLTVLYATVARRHVLYLAAMTAAMFCRENLLVLVGFHVLFHFRERKSLPRFALVLLIQLVPIAAFWWSRHHPLHPPSEWYDALVTFVFYGSHFLATPEQQARFLVAHLNALGVLALMPLFFWRELWQFAKRYYEWTYYVAISLCLTAGGGLDLDRFATWQAPALVAFVVWLSRHKHAPSTHSLLVLFLLQLVAMELPLGWPSSEDFYFFMNAAQATGWGYTVGVVGAVVIALGAWLVLEPRGERAPIPCPRRDPTAERG